MASQQMEEIVKKMKLGYEVMALDATATTAGLAVLWNPEEVILSIGFLSLEYFQAGLE